MNALICPIIAGAATCIALVVAVLLARWRWGMSQPLGYGLDFLCLLPLVIPPDPLWSLFLAISLQRGQWFPDPGLATAFVFSIVPFPILYLAARCAFSKVDSDLIDAARTLGLGPCGIFWRVMIPSGWPWLAGGFLLGLVRAYLEFSSNGNLWMPGALAAILAFALLLQLPKRTE